MAGKLTLSIDENLIGFAHSYARENGLSVSKLFETYLVQLKTSEPASPFAGKTASLYGIFEDNPIPDKRELRSLFHEKGSR
ncbi:DUF6364 family protein [Treponema sp. HNW]|uniref:DUF6364 family protein n=1 Tax=Treponema sp. HNW TaxID=3116654 RepID=UPI003D09EAD6